MKCPVGGDPVNDGRPMPCMVEFPKDIEDAIRQGKVKGHALKILRKWAYSHWQDQDPFLRHLHFNFIMSNYHGSKYSSNTAAAARAYIAFYAQEKQRTLMIKKKGVSAGDPVSIQNGKYFIGDREVNREEMQKMQKMYPGIRMPEPPVPGDPMGREIIPAIYGKNRVK